MKKRYGDVKTHIRLTDKARRLYDRICPVSIYEIDDWDAAGEPLYLYDVDVIGDKYWGLTEAEVNNILEEYYDEFCEEVYGNA